MCAGVVDLVVITAELRQKEGGRAPCVHQSFIVV